MLNISVLVSGGGTNLQALLDAQAAGELKNGRITAVISSRADAFALKRARAAGVPGYVVSRRDYADRDEFTRALLCTLEETKADLVVMAGFLHVVSPRLIRAYANRILNVHPSLIPAFCGEGYYGLRVHEQALAYGVKLTGATVHFVSEDTDAGPIILQKAVPVLPGDTPETLQRRVMEQAEWILLPRAVSLFCEGKLRAEGRQVLILEEEI